MKKQKTKVKKTVTSAAGKTNKGYLLLEGAAIGAALGAGVVAFAKSGAGKKLGKQAKKGGEDFLKYLAPQVKKVKKMGEAEYKNLVNKAMQRYRKDERLSSTEAQRLVKEAQASWKRLTRQL